MFTKHLYRYIPLFILTFILLPETAKATHIVGGEMTYICQGNDNYQVTLTVYRDCENGIPNFDDPAHIGVFDSNNQLIPTIGNMGVLDIPYVEDDTLQPVLFDSCLVIPPNVCVDVTTYVFDVNLPFRTGGYRLAYQRCCRNNTIINIIEPEGTGATYTIDITEEALLLCNSSPTFREWPPIYICVNEPIFFDHGANDLEGDSLVYSLCTPFDGAERDACIPPNTIAPCFDALQPCGPIPCPPFNPPFQNVVWSASYDVDDMLGGIPLSIDPATGFMTGTPNTVGQFVVGICMEEFRDGVLISTTRRDFQYNIGICGQATASFFTPEIICEGLEVEFTSESINAETFEWHFNDPAFPDSISFEENPSYTFSDTGTYDVLLIVIGQGCLDSFERSINLQLPSLFAEFDFQYANCTDSLTIDVSDLSFDTISNIVSWDWELTDDGGAVLGTSMEQNPTFTVITDEPVTLTLVVTAANGCTQELSQVFPANIFTEETFPDEVTICLDEAVPLNPDPFPGVAYSWTPSAGLDNPSSASPLASPDTTTTYVVFIENVGDCDLFDTVTVVVDSIDASFTLDIPCDLEVFFTNTSFNGNNFIWYFNDPLNPGATSIAENPSYTYSVPGNYTAMLVVDNGEYCRDTSFVVFTIEEPPIMPAFEFDVLSCVDSFSLALTDLTMHDDNLDFTWQWYVYEEGTLADSSMLQNPIFTVFTTSNYTIELIVTDENGCIGSIVEMIPVQIFMAGLIPDGTIFCPGDSVLLNPTPFTNVNYTWLPPFGLSDANVASPWASPGVDTEYVVTAEDQYGCIFTDTVAILLDSIEANFTVDVPCDFEVFFTNNSINAQTSTWFFNDPGNPGATSMETNPSFIYSDTGSFTAMLVIESGQNCLDTAFQEFFIDEAMILPAFEFEVLNCTDSFTLALTDQTVHLGGLTFDWTWYIYEGNQPIDTFTVQNPEVSVFTSNTYTIELIITDSDGCTSTISQEIPVQIFTTGMIPDVSILCPVDSILLNPDPLPNVTYTWSPADGLSDPLIASPMALPMVTTTYFVTAEDQYGCVFNDTVIFNIDNFLPPLDGFVIPDTIFQGDTAAISTTFFPTYQYNWQFSESLSDLFISNPLAFPLETTTYTLDIIDENGCPNTIQLQVVVIERICDEPNVFLPNAFTPNGDGENDVLRLLGNGIDEMHLVIYNRWGQKVFETFDQNTGWDGTFKGELLAPDAYGFYLTVRCANQEEFYKQGNITLLK